MTKKDDIIQSIESRYNADANLPGPYNHPEVTATDWQLLGLINILIAEIARLEKRVFTLEKNQVCPECGERGIMSGVNLCPDCTKDWVENR